jgi:hypothetical protein
MIFILTFLSGRYIFDLQNKKKIRLQGRVKFPTGGIVHDLVFRYGLNWCNSSTDSTVWMEEDGVSLNSLFEGSIFIYPFCGG